MVGDLIIFIKMFFIQNTCYHNYKDIYRKDTGGGFKQCTKCGKLD